MNVIKSKQPVKTPNRFNRIAVLRYALIILGVILIGRLFYVQIVRHEYYATQALAEHIKKFEIPAQRGIIRFSDGSDSVPVVLNEERYTIYADPFYITDPKATAEKLVGIIGGNEQDIEQKIQNKDSRYVVLAKKMTKDQADRIDALELKGIGKKGVSGRTYPQGTLASQLLGFVNDDGKGQYGIEEYLNDELSGTAGLQKAVTDVRGVPLAVNNDNVLKNAEDGDNVTLTIDITMQRIAEDALKSGIERTQAQKGSAIILEAKTGKVKAMANYPTYDPGQYDKIADASIFTNDNVSGAWEPGSVMKPLLLGAAFTEGTASINTTYFDAGYVDVDGVRIPNALNWGAQTMTFTDLITKSLNVGAVFALKTLGGGDINEQARQTWYTYLTQHYLFGKKTGIEQVGEADGVVYGPDEGYGVNVRYANMAFGQGMTETPIQIVAAYAAMLNGGTYYKPTLIASTTHNSQTTDHQPQVVAQNIVSADAINQVKELLQKGLQGNNRGALRSGYELGAKSGTAQVPDGQGGYRPDFFDGVYVGYIAGADGVEYIILTRLDGPKTSGFASAEAAKTWADISNKLLDTYPIKPKS